MKPRIFIAIHYLEIGGAESSLIGLLEALDPRLVDIDLFVYAHHGLYMKAIPEYVNLLPENKAWSMFEESLSRVICNGYLRMAYARIVAKLKTKKYYRSTNSPLEHLATFSYLGNEVSKVLPTLKHLGLYDLAISYLNPHDFVLKKVSAKKKICWIHTDYSRISIERNLELPIWEAYDKIVSISPDVTTSFLSVFPSLKEKILECENLLPQKYILKKASEKDDKVFTLTKNGVVNICSIGRVSYAKNYDNIPYIAAELKKLGLNFRWFIVGPGNHDMIDALSIELGVSNEVVFVGASENPYVWLNASDIYVHPSRYEGKSIAVREAQILCKPVIITNYPTAKSQINDGVDGIICDFDNKKIADAIAELYTNSAKMLKIKEYLKNRDYSGKKEVNKIYDIINQR